MKRRSWLASLLSVFVPSLLQAQDEPDFPELNGFDNKAPASSDRLPAKVLPDDDYVSVVQCVDILPLLGNLRVPDPLHFPKPPVTTLGRTTVVELVATGPNPPQPNPKVMVGFYISTGTIEDLVNAYRERLIEIVRSAKNNPVKYEQLVEEWKQDRSTQKSYAFPEQINNALQKAEDRRSREA